ncbi:hypothetical protein MRX96_050551 [Rhipicephalus microplus]
MRCYAPVSCELSAAAAVGLLLYPPGLRRPQSSEATPTVESRWKMYSDFTWNVDEVCAWTVGAQRSVYIVSHYVHASDVRFLDEV